MAIGGTELNAVRTAERLDRERFALSVFCHVPDGPLRERYETMGITVHPVPIRGMFLPSTLLQAKRVARQLRALGVDVVHTHDRYTNVFGAVAAHLAGVRGLITSRRWWDVVPRRVYRVANRLAYRSSSRVLANSAAVGRLLSEADRVPAGRIAVVPNFLEEEAFTPPSPAERRQWRNVHGIPASATVVGCVANLRPVKDHRTLLTAFQAVAARNPDTWLVLAGDGPSRADLQRLAAELGIGTRTLFIGTVSNRPNIHHHFDVSALTSTHEGFPNSLVEAMAAGRPVVATNVGGVSDAVENGQTGLLAPRGDAGAVAAALSRLLTDPAERTAMGARAIAAARESYSADLVLPRLEALYEALAGDPARP
jgi:glycosyltransferase involved in cell wall biosynthesis